MSDIGHMSGQSGEAGRRFRALIISCKMADSLADATFTGRILLLVCNLECGYLTGKILHPIALGHMSETIDYNHLLRFKCWVCVAVLSAKFLARQRCRAKLKQNNQWKNPFQDVPFPLVSVEEHKRDVAWTGTWRKLPFPYYAGQEAKNAPSS